MSLRVIPLLTIASLACATGCTGTDSAIDSPAPPSSNAAADDDTTTSTIGASVDSASTDPGLAPESSTAEDELTEEASDDEKAAVNTPRPSLPVGPGAAGQDADDSPPASL